MSVTLTPANTGSGKTKDVVLKKEGRIVFRFKDTVTGNTKTGIVDPGGNRVVGTVPGTGLSALRFSEYFFNKFTAAGIPNHFISCDFNDLTMVAKQATLFGMRPTGLLTGPDGVIPMGNYALELVFCDFAEGSIRRKFPKLPRGTPLGGWRVHLKHDDWEDPEVNKEQLTHEDSPFCCMTEEIFDKALSFVEEARKVFSDEFAERGLRVIDGKFELGVVNPAWGQLDNGIIVLTGGDFMLIDDIGLGNFRIFNRDGVPFSENSTEAKKIVAEKFFSYSSK